MYSAFCSRGARLAAVMIVIGSLNLAQSSARANPTGITNVDPFFGQYFESFTSFFLGSADQYSIFSDVGDIRSDDNSASIFITTSSTFGSDTVNARTGKMAGQFGIADYDFNQPASQFGGYWENNSGADDAMVEFFDVNNVSLGTVTASVPVHGQQWVWNGWSFDTPVSRIRIVGNGLDNGFIWYDDMQLNTVPEPASAALFVLCGVLLSRRRDRSF